MYERPHVPHDIREGFEEIERKSCFKGFRGSEARACDFEVD